MVLSIKAETKARRANPRFVKTDPSFRAPVEALDIWTRAAIEIISYNQRMLYGKHRARVKKVVAESPPGETDRDFVMRTYAEMYKIGASHMCNNIMRWICDHAGAPYLRNYTRKKTGPRGKKEGDVDDRLEIELDARSSQSKDINPDSIL